MTNNNFIQIQTPRETSDNNIISADLSTRPDMLIFITFCYTNITQGAAKLETNIKKKIKKI